MRSSLTLGLLAALILGADHQEPCAAKLLLLRAHWLLDAANLAGSYGRVRPAKGGAWTDIAITTVGGQDLVVKLTGGEYPEIGADLLAEMRHRDYLWHQRAAQLLAESQFKDNVHVPQLRSAMLTLPKELGGFGFVVNRAAGEPWDVFKENATEEQREAVHRLFHDAHAYLAEKGMRNLDYRADPEPPCPNDVFVHLEGPNNEVHITLIDFSNCFDPNAEEGSVLRQPRD